jgi:DNA-binding NarL/FixJ family response regulator
MRNQPKREMAFKYHLKGLTFSEIGKLLDLSARTIERYSQDDRWKEKANCDTRVERVRQLRAKGLSHTEIAAKMGISRSTVYNYLKATESSQDC